MAATLVLASTSTHKRVLLARLGLPFVDCDPGVREHARPGEAPRALASRLAAEKATAVAAARPGDWVIGADQVAELDGRTLGKPGSRENARAQLQAGSGRCVTFHTATCLLGGPRNLRIEHIDLTHARFRSLREDEIERYLDREPAFDCAGSFHCEGLGIALFEAIETSDPTALVGLPLIGLARLLRRAGFEVP